jgi:hypothetical protein
MDIKNILKSPGYQTFSVHGYTQTEPMYHDVQIDYTKFESCMIGGQIFVQHAKVPFVVTIRQGNLMNKYNQKEDNYDRQKEIQAEIRFFTSFET